MSFVGGSTPRSRRISKKNRHMDLSLTSPRRNTKLMESGKATPHRDRMRQLDSEKTVKQEPSSLMPLVSAPNLNYFQSYNSYTLGSINSISFSNGRIYDLLHIKKDAPHTLKFTKCKCSRSKCMAKYCECFSHGNACGPLCSCEGCQNLVNNKPSVKKVDQDRVCGCSKSGCLKNYCECYQRGEACSSKCKCQNCKNTGSGN